MTVHALAWDLNMTSLVGCFSAFTFPASVALDTFQFTITVRRPTSQMKTNGIVLVMNPGIVPATHASFNIPVRSLATTYAAMGEDVNGWSGTATGNADNFTVVASILVTDFYANVYNAAGKVLTPASVSAWGYGLTGLQKVVPMVKDVVEVRQIDVALDFSTYVDDANAGTAEYGQVSVALPKHDVIQFNLTVTACPTGSYFAALASLPLLPSNGGVGDKIFLLVPTPAVPFTSSETEMGFTTSASGVQALWTATCTAQLADLVELAGSITPWRVVEAGPVDWQDWFGASMQFLAGALPVPLLPPGTVTWTGPAPTTVFHVGDTVALSATIVVAPTTMAFLVNGVVLSEDATAPFTASWVPSTAGTYTLKARAYNASGQSDSAESVVTVIDGPTVAHQTPVGGWTGVVGREKRLSAIVSASGPASVQFFVNAVSIGTVTAYPYTLEYVPPSAGTKAVTIQATSGAVTVTSASQNLIVSAAPAYSGSGGWNKEPA